MAAIGTKIAKYFLPKKAAPNKVAPPSGVKLGAWGIVLKKIIDVMIDIKRIKPDFTFILKYFEFKYRNKFTNFNLKNKIILENHA